MKLLRTITMALVALSLPLSPAIRAYGAVTGNDSFRTSDVRTFQDIGCREQDLVTLQEDVRGHVVLVNGGLRVNVLMSGVITFGEEGQDFVGSFAYPFTLMIQAGGSSTITQAYTAIAKDDEGDVAVLHVTAHTTYVASSGTATSDFVIVHQSCS
jgi:hypothetical protein